MKQKSFLLVTLATVLATSIKANEISEFDWKKLARRIGQTVVEKASLAHHASIPYIKQADAFLNKQASDVQFFNIMTHEHYERFEQEISSTVVDTSSVIDTVIETITVASNPAETQPLATECLSAPWFKTRISRINANPLEIVSLLSSAAIFAGLIYNVIQQFKECDHSKGDTETEIKDAETETVNNVN